MPAACQAEDRFGLFFRTPDNLSGYLFGLTCDGRYSMTAWDGQTTTVLVEPTANPAIVSGAGQPNRLGVVAAGGAYALYANGTLLQVLQDYSFTEAGRLGYFVRAASESGFTVQYDSLAVWLLEPLAPGSTSGQLASVIATSVAATPGLVGTTVPGNTPVTPLTPQPTFPPAQTQTPTPVYTGDLIGLPGQCTDLRTRTGNPVTMEDPDKYVVRFNPDGTLDVKSDCNTGVGVYSLRSDNRITIDLTSGTTKDCGEGSYSALFFERLESASNYEVDGDEMTLALTSGGNMQFSAARLKPIPVGADAGWTG